MYLQPHGGGPTEFLLDESVVRVSPSYTLWAGDVVDWELLILKTEDDLSHLVHAHHLITSNIHRLTEI